MTITWKEFKDHIDEKLKEKGIPEDIEIHYIDFSWVDKPDELILGIESFRSGKRGKQMKKELGESETMICDCGQEMIPLNQDRTNDFQRFICPIFNEPFDQNLNVDDHPMKFRRKIVTE